MISWKRVFVIAFLLLVAVFLVAATQDSAFADPPTCPGHPSCDAPGQQDEEPEPPDDQECPGNSCEAPGQQDDHSGKPDDDHEQCDEPGRGPCTNGDDNGVGDPQTPPDKACDNNGEPDTDCSDDEDNPEDEPEDEPQPDEGGDDDPNGDPQDDPGDEPEDEPQEEDDDGGDTSSTYTEVQEESTSSEPGNMRSLDYNVCGCRPLTESEVEQHRRIHAFLSDVVDFVENGDPLREDHEILSLEVVIDGLGADIECPINPIQDQINDLENDLLDAMSQGGELPPNVTVTASTDPNS